MNNSTWIQGYPPTVQPFASLYATTGITEFGIQHLLLVLLAISFTNFINGIRIKRKFLLFAKAAKCSPVPQASNRFPMPWSLNRKYDIYKACLRGDLFDNHFRRLHDKYGKTHAIVSPLSGRQKGINTIEPENFKAVFSTNFKDYKRSKYRLLASQPMLPPGILTMDGHEWAHWRSLIRTQFTRKNFDANIAASERHMQLTFKAFKPVDPDGWTSEINLMDHVYRLAMDTVTQFLFGHSAETQSVRLIRLGLLPPPSTPQPAHLDTFAESFVIASHYVGHRIKLSNMYFLLDSLAYRRACRSLRQSVTAYVNSALSLPDSDKLFENDVLAEMASHGASLDEMVAQVTHLLVAGMDTSSATLGWMFAMLSEHPEVYEKLREEVLRTFGTEEARLQEFDLERLKGCTYLQWCFQEVLRLFPAGPVNVRVAVRDTVLPVGGGKDGKEPVAVRAGARVQMGVYLAHRRKDIWGDDAEAFRPERWEGKRRGWEFTPFSGGPQICLGQGYSVAQVSFFIARIVMRYDKIEAVEGSENLKQGWMSVLTPAAGVRVRMRLAEGSRN